MTDTTTITLDEVGAVRHLEIPLPADGGVVVLEGANGQGKSTALAAVDALRTGSTKGLTAHDEAEGTGIITGLGVSIEVGRARARRRGEPDDRLVVTEMAGTIDPAALVDPGIADPEAADRRRIKALIDLGGVEASADDWIPIAGDRADLAEAVDLNDLPRMSPVDVAGALKRDLEKRARAHEKREQAHAAENAAQLELLEGIDLTAPHDEEQLAADHEDAVRQLSTAEARAGEAERAREQHAVDAERLAELEADADGTVEDAERDLASASGVLTEYETRRIKAEADVERLEKALADARGLRDELRAHEEAAASNVESLRSVLRAREQSADARHVLRERLGAYVAPEDMEAELQERRDLVVSARYAMETGSAVRRALAHQERAAAARKAAAEEAGAAKALRDRAAETEGVLSRLVKAAGIDTLAVRGGRLVVDHPTRGRMPFADLSHGERWRIAFDAAVHRVGEGGIVAVRQEAWEGLDPENRDAIHAAARAARVTVLTARAADGEVRAVVHGEEG